MELARMPSFAYWMAVDFVSNLTAPFEALYEAEGATDQASNGGEIDYRTSTSLPHGRYGDFGSQEHSFCIDVHYLVPRLWGGILYLLHWKDTSAGSVMRGLTNLDLR